VPVTDSFWFPLGLSLRVATLSVALLVVPGTWLGYLLARRRFPGRALLDAALMLPLVLPPSVTGYFLILLLGRRGLLGAPLYRATGFALPFTFWAAVLAALTVALPLYVKAAQAAFSQVALDLEETAYTLGLSPARTFRVVTLPLARRGLVAAAVLAFARAVGEFGATLILAGNIPGRTNTMPLEIYSAYQTGDDARALALVAILSAVSLVVVLVANRFGRGTVV
jgi:molybdate transport system permease protein